MGHSHSHADHHDHGDHHHSHHVDPSSMGRSFAIGIALNLAFVCVEGAYGHFSNSLALWSDAGHNLSDVLGLVLAWFAMWLSKRSPTSHYTYGWRSSSILVAVINAVLLLCAVGGIIFEAIQRFGAAPSVQGGTVMIVAAIGIVINGLTAWLFVAGSKGDLNIRGAFLHMAADALVSLGVVVAGLVILKTGWAWIDPTVSIVIGIVIFAGTWKLLKDSVSLALDGVPTGIELNKVREFILTKGSISSVHDLHVWGLSTSQAALTAHVVCQQSRLDNKQLFELEESIQKEFDINHITLQVEYSDQPDYVCPLNVGACV